VDFAAVAPDHRSKLAPRGVSSARPGLLRLREGGTRGGDGSAALQHFSAGNADTHSEQ